MPLKIRCPHCHRVLVAEDAASGQQKLCPACKQAFMVPRAEDLPRLSSRDAPLPERRQCPRCKTEVGPSTRYCPKCPTDLRTGQLLPWSQRIRYIRWQTWVGAAVGLIALVIMAVVSVQWLGGGEQAVESRFQPFARSTHSETELPERLLNAANRDERWSVLTELKVHEPGIALAVATALRESLVSGERTWNIDQNRRAAIDLLARNAHQHANDLPGWLAVLYELGSGDALYPSAVRARALFGDTSVAGELVELWLAAQRRLLLLERIRSVADRDEDVGTAVAVGTAQADVAYLAHGLRALVMNDEKLVFDALCERYWDTWQWLGQDAGDAYADAVFELARTDEASLTFRPEDVREPRDVLKRVAERATPRARAAAALVIGRRGPQYRSLARRICDTLGALLPECVPVDQQRMTWTISSLRGRIFGAALAAHPLDVREQEIAAAWKWAHPDQTPALAGPVPQPPVLDYLAVTPQRQLEQELLNQLDSGWDAVDEVSDGWRWQRLGCAPTLGDLLNPAQQEPDRVRLVLAMIVVAEHNCQQYRPQLELWRDAVDQPEWLRGLAYCTLGSLDAQSDDALSGWPVGLMLGDTAAFGIDAPPWEFFGRVIAAGGNTARRVLRDSAATDLTPAVRTKLLEAARRAAERVPSQAP